jgi:hypothetical protein
MPPLPDGHGVEQHSLFIRTYGWGIELQTPDPEWDNASGTKYAWLEETRPLIGDEPLTAFTRAAMAGDVSNAIAHRGFRAASSTTSA